MNLPDWYDPDEQLLVDGEACSVCLHCDEHFVMRNPNQKFCTRAHARNRKLIERRLKQDPNFYDNGLIRWLERKHGPDAIAAFEARDRTEAEAGA